MAPVGLAAVSAVVPAVLDGIAGIVAASRPAPEVAAARAAHRVGHDAWSMARHDGRLAGAQDRLQRAVARGGWQGRLAASRLVAVSREIETLHEIMAIHTAFQRPR